ncbi:MAG: ATP-grasp domain-containing protein [SAR324 cluster bacterium]|nr:ATP-grasp domain-containing protein [SAR324 cluster bacterium]MCZ6627195.1 ATP-grasp domain-containing protein [SAR324 cluster bacterium]
MKHIRAVKRILLLMKSESYRAPDFIAAAGKLGVDLVVGSDKPSVLAEFRPRSTLELNFQDVEDGARAAAEFHLEQPLDGVVAVEDEGTVLASRVAARLRLPANPEESAVASRNKFMFREITSTAGIAAPWFRKFPVSSDPHQVAQQIPYPCVLKPLFLSAGRGVIRADNQDEFVAAFSRITKLLRDPEIMAAGGEDAQWLLVESFIPGAEVSLEGMLEEGKFKLLAFMDKPDPLDGPYFEETLLVTPSRHPIAIQQAAEAEAQAAVTALGLRTGAIHVEMRIEAGHPVLLEVAPRSIGGHCSRILTFSTGLSLEELILMKAVGGFPGDVQREQRAAGVMMIPIPGKGKLQSVTGIEDARAVPGIEDVEITIPVSQPVVPLPEGHRYLGFIFAKGDLPQTVEEALRQAHGELRFRIG